MSGEGLRAERSWVAPLRGALALSGLLLWLLFLVPPVWSWVGRYEFVQAMQFAVFAFGVPVLLVSGAPWARLGLASGEHHHLSEDGERVSPLRVLTIDRLALSRVRSSRQLRAVFVGGAFIALTVFWRVAPIVDFVVRHPWMVVVESLTLVVGGVVTFTFLVESPPMTPATSRPYRICISTAIMWGAWVVAYLDAMSHSSWYHAFHHVAGQGVSRSADQQLSAGLIWLISAAVFVPIIFWNLVYWLQSEEDPNAELTQLIRDERTRGFFGTN